MEDIPAIVDGMREFSELGKFFDLPVISYSSGMMSRLKFAMAMAFDFDCYIIDELSAVGDASFRSKAQQTFEEKRQHASFIKVSHSLGELAKECNCGIVVENGMIHSFDDFAAAAEFYREIIGSGDETEDEDNDFVVRKDNSGATKRAAAKADRVARRRRRKRRPRP